MSLRPQPERERLGLLDRLACALFGALFGALWGLLLAIAVGYATDGRFHADLLWDTIAVFAGLGFVLGPVVGDLIAAVFHFMYGLLLGLGSMAGGSFSDPEPRAQGAMRSLFVVGVGTGIVLFIYWRFR